MWNGARAHSRQNRLLKGRNILLQVTPNGTVITAVAEDVPTTPFLCVLKGQTSATIGTGWVNGTIEPEIGKVPLSGDEQNGPPTLTWFVPELGEDKTGYIALEIQCDEQWVPIKEHAVKVIQCAYFDRDLPTDPAPEIGAASGSVPLLAGYRARWPLARLIMNQKTQQLSLRQITHGDIQFKAAPRVLGSTTGRGFFS